MHVHTHTHTHTSIVPHVHRRLKGGASLWCGLYPKTRRARARLLQPWVQALGLGGILGAATTHRGTVTTAGTTAMLTVTLYLHAAMAAMTHAMRTTGAMTGAMLATGTTQRL